MGLDERLIRISLKVRIIESLRPMFKLSELLRCAQVSRGSYYYHRDRLDIPDKYEDVKAVIKAIYEENERRYGYRRITGELSRRGVRINHKTVLRLMKQMNIKAVRKRRRYKSYKGDFGKLAPNLLKRQFHAERPNEKWVTDVTEFHVGENKLYLSPIMDLYNYEIIAYDLAQSPNMAMIKRMLTRAGRRLRVGDTPILHSDQGFQYQHHLYHLILGENSIRPSMSRKGNCLDNAAMEGFFGQLKSELFYVRKYSDIEKLREDIEGYIDYYNNKRIRESLGFLSPVEFREAGIAAA